MPKRRHGRIISVSSVSGSQASAEGPHYVGRAASNYITGQIAVAGGGRAIV